MKIKCPECGFTGLFSHEQRSVRQKEVMLRAKQKGVIIGRPIIHSDEKILAAFKKAGSVNGAAKLAKCHRASVYRVINKGSKPVGEKE